jgi:hypothetical protein
MADLPRLPGIPSITPVKDQTIANILTPMRESIQILSTAIYGGMFPNGQTVTGGGNSAFIGGVGVTTVSTYDPYTDYTPPPAPTNFLASGALLTVILDWDKPTYANHAYTEVWRASVNALGAATLIGSTTAAVYSDTVGNGSTYYYWIRHLSKANVTGPYNASAGTAGKTAPDPAYLLSVLSGSLTTSQLATDLNTRIKLIDAPSTTVGSVNARINVVQSQVNDLLNIPAYSSGATYTTGQQVTYNGGLYVAKSSTTGHAPTDTTYWTKLGDYTSLGDAVAANTTAIANLGTDLGTEVTNRSTLASQLRGNYTGTDITLISSGLIYEERQARSSAVSAIATDVSTLSASLNTKSTVYAQTTAPATANIGDLWMDLNYSYVPDYYSADYSIKSNRLYRWNGTAWIEALDYGFADTFATINIEKIARVTADNAMATQITTLFANANTNAAAISTESTTRANADSSLATQITTLTSRLGPSGDVGSAIIQSQSTATTGVVNAATAQTTADAKVKTFFQGTAPTASTIGDIWVDSANSNLIKRWSGSAWAAADDLRIGATATTVSTLSTTVAGHTTSISTNTTSINGLRGSYSVKIDNNGVMTGFGLTSDIVDGGAITSKFLISANQFAVIAPGATAGDPSSVPFAVLTTAQTINGVAFEAGVYIDGASIVDGTIKNAKIGSGAIDDTKISDMSAAKIKVGFLSPDRIDANSITADKIGTGTLSASTNIYVGGTNTNAPLVLTGGGEIISNGSNGDKARFYSGNVEIYKNVPNVGSVVYKALSRAEFGVADNSTVVTIPGYFKSQPKVIVSPSNISLFKASYSGQDQSLQCAANNIAETSAGSMVWQFTPVATLSLAANTGSTVVNQASGNQTSSWYSSEYVTPSNTATITPSVTLTSNRGNGSSNYYYRSVRWRVEYWNGSSWVVDPTWTTSDIGASTTNSVTTTKTFSFPSSTAWRFRIYCEAYDTNGTVFGSTAYEYATDTVTRADTVYFATYTGNTPSGSYAPSYSVPSGWTVTSVAWTYHYTFEMRGGDGATGGLATLAMPGTNISASHVYVGGYGAGYYGELKSGTNVLGTVTNSSLAFGVSVSAGTGAYSYVYMLDNKAVITRRRPIANSTTANNNYQFNSYAYALTSAQVLASGSLNWIALGD